MSAQPKKSTDRVCDLIEKTGACMLTTQSEHGLRARPIEARPGRDSGLIWFVTDVRSGKEHEIEARQEVGLVFIDAAEKHISQSPPMPRFSMTRPRRPRSGN
jgi:general stress protein 26